VAAACAALAFFVGQARFVDRNDAAAAALDVDDECGGLAAVAASSRGGDDVACAANALQLRSKATGLPNSVHFPHDAPNARESLPNGVQLERWSSPHSHHSGGLMPAEITDRPPHVTKIVLKPGQRFPPEGARMTTGEDVMYVFAAGGVRCEFCRGGQHDLTVGDLFFTTAHRPHGPLVNHGPSEAVVMVASMHRYAYEIAGRSKARSFDVLTTQRLLRDPGPDKESKGWGPSGLAKFAMSEKCWSTGKVMVHNWGEMLNMPNVMAVRLGGDCFVPCHEHPSGALYFVLSGTFHIHGDRGPFNSTFVAGDMRWVRPNFVYGPEYSGHDGDVRLIVLGVPGSMTPGMCKR